MVGGRVTRLVNKGATNGTRLTTRTHGARDSVYEQTTRVFIRVQKLKGEPMRVHQVGVCHGSTSQGGVRQLTRVGFGMFRGFCSPRGVLYLVITTRGRGVTLYIFVDALGLHHLRVVMTKSYVFKVYPPSKLLGTVGNNHNSICFFGAYFYTFGGVVQTSSHTTIRGGQHFGAFNTLLWGVGSRLQLGFVVPIYVTSYGDGYIGVNFNNGFCNVYKVYTVSYSVLTSILQTTSATSFNFGNDTMFYHFFRGPFYFIGIFFGQRATSIGRGQDRTRLRDTRSFFLYFTIIGVGNGKRLYTLYNNGRGQTCGVRQQLL